MPADLWTDAVRMADCGLRVAAVAAPIGGVAWLLARRRGERLLPRPRPWRVPWTGFEVVVAFLVLNAVLPGLVFASLAQSGFFQQVYGSDFPPVPEKPAPAFEASAAVAGAAAAGAARDRLAELSTVRGLWTGLLALPFQLGVLWAARAALYPAWRPPGRRATVAARVALGVVGWTVLAPVVLGTNAAVNLAFTGLGWEPEEHPLARLTAARPLLDQFLFLLQASVAAPLVEELLFRGLLLAWVFGGRSALDAPPGSGSVRRPPADRRVWPVLAITLLMAAYLSVEPGRWAPDPTRGPVLFAMLLVVGWLPARRVWRRTRRSAGAVYASAALFAVVHSGVWPSPVPLFVLGLGLGWLAVRTRGVLAPVVVHGLFNAVSVLFVLRGGTG